MPEIRVHGLRIQRTARSGSATDAPGLGVALRPGLADRPDAVVRRTSAP
jgi:hypothetical protein